MLRSKSRLQVSVASVVACCRAFLSATAAARAESVRARRWASATCRASRAALVAARRSARSCSRSACAASVRSRVAVALSAHDCNCACTSRAAVAPASAAVAAFWRRRRSRRARLLSSGVRSDGGRIQTSAGSSPVVMVTTPSTAATSCTARSTRVSLAESGVLPVLLRIFLRRVFKRSCKWPTRRTGSNFNTTSRAGRPRSWLSLASRAAARRKRALCLRAEIATSTATSTQRGRVFGGLCSIAVNSASSSSSV